MPWVGLKFRINVKDSWAEYLFSPSSSRVEILSPTLRPSDLMERAYGGQLCQMGGVLWMGWEFLYKEIESLEPYLHHSRI